jgi:hypothetical protein
VNRHLRSVAFTLFQTVASPEIGGQQTAVFQLLQMKSALPSSMPLTRIASTSNNRRPQFPHGWIPP